MKMKAFVLFAAALSAAYGAEWIENAPAANWQESSRRRAARCLKLLTDKNWLKGGGSCHDWKNCFNTDISGGYPYLISEMLVHSEEGLVRFLPAKPKDWTAGSIKGLLLRGGIVLESLEWKDEGFVATLKFTDGTVKRVEGKAGDGVTLSVDGQTAHNVVDYCPKGVNR